MPFSVHGHCNQHFTNAHHPSSGMRMFHFSSAQIFFVLLQKLDHTGTRGLELLCRLCQSSKAANRFCPFRRLHLVSAVRNHLQERMFAIRSVGWARSALCIDQVELYGLSGCQVLNRIQHAPAIRSRSSTCFVLQSRRQSCSGISPGSPANGRAETVYRSLRQSPDWAVRS